MRIALVSREYPPFFGGGIGTFAEATAHALASQGHAVRVLTQGPPSVEGQLNAAGSGVVVHRLGEHTAGGFVAHELRFAVHAARCLARLSAHGLVDAAEFVDTEGAGVAACLAHALGARLPAIAVSHHTSSPHMARLHSLPLDGPAAAAALRFAEHVTTRCAHANAAPSTHFAEWTRRYARLPQRPQTIRNPLPAALAGPRRGRASASGVRTIVYLGRLEPRKGVESLALAWRLASPQLPGVRLRFIGRDTPTARLPGSPPGRRGSMQAWLVDLLGDAAGTAEFPGAMPPARVAEELAASALLVAPSLWENFPYTVLEAMALGCPVVVSDAGGTAEMVRGSGGGVVVPAGDAHALADALVDTLRRSDASLAAMGRHASAHVRWMCEPARLATERTQWYMAARDQARAAFGPNAAGVGARHEAWRAVWLGARGWLKGPARTGPVAQEWTMPEALETDAPVARVSWDGPASGDVELPLTRATPWAMLFAERAMLPAADAAERLFLHAGALAGAARVEIEAPAEAAALVALWLRTALVDAAAEVAWCDAGEPDDDAGAAGTAAAGTGESGLAARLAALLSDEVPGDAVSGGAVLRAGGRRAVAADPERLFELLEAMVDEWEIRSSGVTGGGPEGWTRRMRAALQRCADRGHTRVAVYGAGTHTRAIGEALRRPPVSIECIIDDAAANHGQTLWNYPIVSQADALARGVQAVVLSSNQWEPQLWERSRPLREAGVEVLRLYRDLFPGLDEGGAKAAPAVVVAAGVSQTSAA